MCLVTEKGDIDSVHAMPLCYSTWTLRKNRMSTHLGLEHNRLETMEKMGYCRCDKSQGRRAYSQSTIGQQNQTHKGKEGKERKTTRPNCHPTITHKTLIPCTESKLPRKRMPNQRAPKLRIPPQNGNYSGTPPPKRKKLSRTNDGPSHD